MNLKFITGAVCQKGRNGSSDHICRLPENCPSLGEQLKRNENPKTCSFNGNKPVVCCIPSTQSVADVETGIVMDLNESMADHSTNNSTNKFVSGSDEQNLLVLAQDCILPFG